MCVCVCGGVCIDFSVFLELFRQCGIIRLFIILHIILSLLCMLMLMQM